MLAARIHRPASSSPAAAKQAALQRQPDVEVDIIHAHQERAMDVVHHFVAAQEKAHRQGHQQEHRGAAQEARFQSAFQPENGRVDFPRLRHIRQLVAQLPGARRQPVEQDADDYQRQHVAAQHAVKRQVEQVKRERLVEHRVAPPAGRRGQVPRAGEAHHRPGVDGRSRDQVAHQQQPQRRKPRVELVVAQGGIREFERARMRDPKDSERHQGRQRDRRHAVIQHAHPRAELPQFLPPRDFDDVRGDGPGAEE
jgi:hypothetical protein